MIPVRGMHWLSCQRPFRAIGLGADTRATFLLRVFPLAADLLPEGLPLAALGAAFLDVAVLVLEAEVPERADPALGVVLAAVAESEVASLGAAIGLARTDRSPTAYSELLLWATVYPGAAIRPPISVRTTTPGNLPEGTARAATAESAMGFLIMRRQLAPVN